MRSIQISNCSKIVLTMVILCKGPFSIAPGACRVCDPPTTVRRCGGPVYAAGTDGLGLDKTDDIHSVRRYWLLPDVSRISCNKVQVLRGGPNSDVQVARDVEREVAAQPVDDASASSPARSRCRLGGGCCRGPGGSALSPPAGHRGSQQSGVGTSVCSPILISTLKSINRKQLLYLSLNV